MPSQDSAAAMQCDYVLYSEIADIKTSAGAGDVGAA